MRGHEDGPEARPDRAVLPHDLGGPQRVRTRGCRATSGRNVACARSGGHVLVRTPSGATFRHLLASLAGANRIVSTRKGFALRSNRKEEAPAPSIQAGRAGILRSDGSKVQPGETLL
jgi:hypothetical protein